METLIPDFDGKPEHIQQIIDAGPDVTYCPGDAASLAGNSLGANETGEWTIIGNNGGVKSQ